MAGYLLVSGQVQLSLRDEDGRYVPLDIVEPGEYFGEQALGTGESRQTTAPAFTPVKVVELDRDTSSLPFLRPTRQAPGKR